jgi:hypothetical protein
MMAEYEVQRVEAVRAAEEARMQADIAREIAREQARLSSADEALSKEERQRLEAEMATARAELETQMAEVRHQLSESHRQLREASREVAQAHRDLAVKERREVRRRVINLGDRAVIGVILGESTEDGVEILGVSPDGPAEKSGLRQGDLIVSFNGKAVTGSGQETSRAVIHEVMSDVETGEEIDIEVSRDGDILEVSVAPERREPQSWQSFIRIDEDENAPHVAPNAPHAPTIHVERIVMPEIDHEVLAEQVEKFKKDFEQFKYIYVDPEDFDVDVEHLRDLEFDHGELSEIAANALREANVLMGVPGTHGLKFAAINPDLGEYFDTKRGVLVLTAKQDNAFELKAGDVLLSVADAEVNSPNDVIRALRDIEEDETFDMDIKRNRKARTLSVVMPQSRWKTFEHKSWTISDS